MIPLTDYREMHSSSTIIVCGCGPSLRELEQPERFITIGVNDVGRLYDPTYLVVLNPRQQFKADRFRYVEASNAQALFTQLDLGRVKPPVVKFRLGQYGGVEIGAGDVLHYTQNSPYVAVCLAAYMGAKRIGLIGVDFTDDHFFAPTGRHALSSRLQEIDRQYGRLAASLAQRGIALVNLGSISRLRTLPRMRIDAAGEWIETNTTNTANTANTIGTLPPRAAQRSDCMKVAIEKRASGVVGQLLEALAGSVAALGHKVVRDPRNTAHDPRVLSIVWNGRGYTTRGPTLYCEHGWLPRADYQISPRGINADSHAAPFAWNGVPLTAEQDADLDRRIEAIKSASFEGYYRYMQANIGQANIGQANIGQANIGQVNVGAHTGLGLPKDFLLVPLQIESDTNLVRHAPMALRTMQGLVDHVSAIDPPWPVIFKQHPADARTVNRHLRLQLRRKQDRLWPQSRGNIHQMLGSGACRGILTINSNVAHDGLLWDVPTIVLGRNIWPRSGELKPFLTAIPQDWASLADSVESAEGIACRRTYARYLIDHQWTLADASDPQRVAELIEIALHHRAMPAPVTQLPRRLSSRLPTGKPPTAAVRKPVVLQRRANAMPIINVVAENKGWLFEHWKQALAGASQPGYRVAASNKPMPQAEAWIFLRATEAARSPDPMRSVVHLHDLSGPDAYRPCGPRADVARCGGILLTHPAQENILRDAGITLAMRRWAMQPVGWGEAQAPSSSSLSSSGDDVPTLAWFGRPATHNGQDVSGLADLVEAVRNVSVPMRVVLIGERLEATAAALKRMGIDCKVLATAHCPPSRVADWIGRFDALAVTSAADCGPWPLFDAVRAGVPVVALRVGWAGTLLADGRCGHLAADAKEMTTAIDAVMAQRGAWRERRITMPLQCPEFSMHAWLKTNLQLAADLVPQQRMAVA